MLENFKKTAVVGAGTMGIGIAEVMAKHGHEVKLYDLNRDFAQSSLNKMQSRLQSRVSRGKISQELADQIMGRIEIVESLEAFSDVQLVIEAIVEKLEVKQQLFKQLEQICDEQTLLATNTSSISVTAIASVLGNPQRLLGLHFFNPAPVMKLVEVIAGLETSESTMKTGLALCEFWNKVGVRAKSTPGFIVNRVARPFYGEALKILQEGVAEVVEIDFMMKNAGFRMGPFELMDLIGIDVNLAVSQTVYATMFYDPRYRPSLIQQEMVYAGNLGKKSGKGFYNYEAEQKVQELEFEPQNPFSSKVLVGSDDSVLKDLVKNNKDFEDLVSFAESQAESLIIDNCAVFMANGETCEQRLNTIMTKAKSVCQVDWVLDMDKCGFVSLSFDRNCSKTSKKAVVGFFQKLDKNVLLVKDSPGLCVARTVAMLINEAADAVAQGVCSESDVDLAMTNGVNYPLGLLKWSEQLGADVVVDMLDNMQAWFGDDRYRASSWLRMRKSFLT